jgi:hypothetical protein
MVVTVVLGGILYELPEMSVPKLLGVLTAKAIVLSVFYYWFIIALKSYRANEHMRLAYDQKRNALTTFKAFVDAADEKQTKDAVLLAATHAIFTMVPTGFVDDAPDPSIAQLASILANVRKG